MAQKRIVHLRVYRGKDLNYDANGKVKNENQLIKCREHSAEYNNHLKYLHLSGYARVDVENVFVEENGEYSKVDAPDIVNDVLVAYYQDEKVAKTDERWTDLNAEKETPIKGVDVVEISKKDLDVDNSEVHETKLPKGKTIDDLNYNALKKLFPNIADLKPQGVADFRAQIRVTYPNL